MTTQKPIGASLGGLSLPLYICCYRFPPTPPPSFHCYLWSWCHHADHDEGRLELKGQSGPTPHV